MSHWLLTLVTMAHCAHPVVPMCCKPVADQTLGVGPPPDGGRIRAVLQTKLFRNRCCCNWLGRLTSHWLKGKLPRGILGTNCRMCQVILVPLDCVETAVSYWAVWIGTWERRELFGCLLWDFCKHMWRLTENRMFGFFLWMSREICDDMWVEKKIWKCLQKYVSEDFCHVRWLKLKVYVMQNYVKISENSVKNLEILLNISRVFCKLVDLGSLMYETVVLDIVAIRVRFWTRDEKWGWPWTQAVNCPTFSSSETGVPIASSKSRYSDWKSCRKQVGPPEYLGVRQRVAISQWNSVQRLEILPLAV